ncbi:MAG: transglutaminase-like domain-containing protein [Planctomycetota bacterium]|jgi:transglutaminase-like putative cysteine protease
MDRSVLPALALALSMAGAAALVSEERVTAAPERGASRAFRIEYRAEMDVPAGARRVRLWLPMPASTARQRVSGIKVASSAKHVVYTDPVYANRVVCVEQTDVAEGPFTVAQSASVHRDAYSVLERISAPSPATPERPELLDEISLFLRPNALVPTAGKIEAEALKVVSRQMSDLEKARAMYDYLTRTFSYDKSVPGYGKGDAIRACDVRKGNCSDVHSLFIGMCRASGLPARFHMGFPVPPDRRSGKIPGYHCWADFYLENVGWVPVDISEAIKDPTRHEELFGGLDADRVHFTTGRDIVLCQEAVPGPQNILIYPVGVVDGEVREPDWELWFEEQEGPAEDAG